jgi:uncharacterized protein YyaL (SSP411 family)
MTLNRLQYSTSPYLLQHAENPVDWYEWTPEAFDKARAEDKPVLLSVGYAACHWCHVMAHESFEDATTAELMNQLFVNIKVDREQRPDIDNIYMTAVQAMTQHGGWPMTVFMTPEGVPFYAGTYFPPEDRHQMPSFRRVLQSVAEAYNTRRAEVVSHGQELIDHMREATATRLPARDLNYAALDDAYANLHGQFDQTYGGFGRAPKFPQPMTFEFLLRYAVRTNTPLARVMLERSLRAMAEGGMYDQLGGGFHRYSVDAKWLVPHFEKMLYDNALLVNVYLEAYQAYGDPFYGRIAEETLDYLVREMRHPDGAFYSTQDADSYEYHGASHKEEGAFFVWTLPQLREALGADAMVFAALYDVTERGNFEGKNILNVKRSPADVTRVTGMNEAQIAEVIARSKATLFELRKQRPAPGLDDKVITAWNGMALRAFALAARVLDRDDYRHVAVANAEFLLSQLRRADGTLLRVWKNGKQDPILGFLEDHALLADGLLALYEATFDDRWLLEAKQLADIMQARFWDDAIGGFYDTATDHEALVIRPRDTGDNATPSGNSAAASVLLRLAIYFDEPLYRDHAAALLESISTFMQRYPTGFGRYLAAAEFLLNTPREVVVVADPHDPSAKPLLDSILKPFRPNQIVALMKPDTQPLPLPLLAGRTQINAQPTVYVCQNYTCQLPVTNVAALEQQLA